MNFRRSASDFGTRVGAEAERFTGLFGLWLSIEVAVGGATVESCHI